jgi:hypothetical protein
VTNLVHVSDQPQALGDGTVAKPALHGLNRESWPPGRAPPGAASQCCHQQIGVQLIKINLFRDLLLTIILLLLQLLPINFLQVSGLLFAITALGPRTSLLRLIDDYYCDEYFFISIECIIGINQIIAIICFDV